MGDPATTAANFEKYRSPGNLQLPIDGGEKASVAGVLSAPLGYITTVTGAEAITGLDLPYPDFCGTIVLIPLGAFTLTNATNIAIAVQAVVGKALHMTYLPRTGKWYPSNAA